MIRINLLPHREMARKRRTQLFRIVLLLSLLAGLALAALLHLWLQQQLQRQQARNRLLQSEMAVLEAHIREIAVLENEISALHARRKAVEALQADRNLPVQLLSGLVQLLPEEAYLSQLRQQEQFIELKGVAQSSEQVSDLLRSLASGSPWFAQPELQEIAAMAWPQPGRAQRQAVSFALRFRLRRLEDGPLAPRAGAAAKAGG